MDAVDYVIEQCASGRVTREQLLDVFGGSRARMSEAMNKKRGLSVNQIRRLHFDLGLDASALLRPVERS